MSAASEPVLFVVRDDEDGLRPDRLVRRRHPEVARDQALAWLKAGRMRLDDTNVRLASRVQPGQHLALDVAIAQLGPAADLPAASTAALKVLFASNDLVAVDKPAGLAMHSGTRVDDDDTLKGMLARAFPSPVPEQEWDVRPRRGGNGKRRVRAFVGPSFLGRLDRPTSGVVLAARTREGLQQVEPSWSAGDVEKTYVVVVHGQAPAEGVIDIPLVSLRARKKRKPADDDARTEEAVTLLHRLAASPDGRLSVVLAFLRTGRTHQIRRHLKAIGHPLVGDPRYGHRRRDQQLQEAFGVDVDKALQLHCMRLQFAPAVHDVTGLPRPLWAPWPARMQRVLGAAGLDVNALQQQAHNVHVDDVPETPLRSRRR